MPNVNLALVDITLGFDFRLSDRRKPIFGNHNVIDEIVNCNCVSHLFYLSSIAVIINGIFNIIAMIANVNPFFMDKNMCSFVRAN